MQGSLGPVPTQATAIGLLQLYWNEIAQGGQQGSGQGLSPAYITLTLSAKRANIARPCVIYTNPIFEQFFGNRR